MITLEQVLVWLPVWMRADFDCPDYGPHDWFPRVTTRGNHYTWCRNCNRRKVDAWPSTAPPETAPIVDLRSSSR